MKQTITRYCLTLCLVFFIPQPGLFSAAPQSLAELVKTGSVNLTRDIVISENEFPDEVYFQNPRGIAVHQDGRIYITDSSANNIKMINAEGGLMGVLGQEGQGPGDFRSPSFISIAQDRLIIWESMNRRFSILDLDGTFVTSVKIDDELGVPSKMRALPDGRMVVMTEAQVEIDGKLTQFFRVFLLSPDLEIEKVLYSRKLLRRKLIAEPMRVYVPQPYTPYIHWDVTPQGLVIVGCSDEYKIEIHDPDRGRLRVFSHKYTPVRITDADKEHHFSIFTMNVFVGNKIETKQGAPDYIRDNTEFPKYKPAFKELAADDEGNIWIRPFHEDRQLENQLFDIFDRDGQFMGRITISGETTFPSFLTTKIKNKIYWEVEQVADEFFRIVRNTIGR